MLDRAVIAGMFPNFDLVGTAANIDDGTDLVLEHKPDLIFLNIDQQSEPDGFSLSFIAELHRYLITLPTIVVLSDTTDKAIAAIKYGVFDYLNLPLSTPDLRKCLAKFSKSFSSVASTTTELPQPENLISQNVIVTEVEKVDADLEQVQLQNGTITGEGGDKSEKPLVICVKSYGDYRFINASDICYLQADNNSTDLHLINGEMITAFKTLKHFENVLNQPFVRIHNSYIVNVDYVSRIHTGNSVCFLKNSTIKLPFSKSYKENVEMILKSMANGNYLEI